MYLCLGARNSSCTPPPSLGCIALQRGSRCCHMLSARLSVSLALDVVPVRDAAGRQASAWPSTTRVCSPEAVEISQTYLCHRRVAFAALSRSGILSFNQIPVHNGQIRRVLNAGTYADPRPHLPRRQVAFNVRLLAGVTYHEH
jgi:hypothetical protein